ncbi:16S rRNA (guanine(966)-N(2))-methyltransferase RsmD [Varunaivibrio sulfuroxidans]|uniref:16S rRNA (Guanine966-N2)-methyltransferase n=1 Tax=Varunaivibrio sulfuroxidans TaxID=1773489 RepID=A0A4R3J5M2_9PROT|nr:16S rRNA (guanine(966)-N(2))-methyltransferase RsmD [Varunaivibrio sulfuroxidans]TCS60625.1 16S rRNA (guanine966-N2)-methyltransferase [Varunaivibrio sulfuroxidans]WES30114.1 16S rRNA (guanine(966)-N(2))-methyltransferase RsmD [Varunaivibrio sulfuroxidans]
MRIVGGVHKGRAIAPPKGSGTRPTADRAREAIFNVIAHGLGLPAPIQEAAVVDVFAGTGALGLEALSRGARFATFIEHDRQAARIIAGNVATLGETARSLTLSMDARRIFAPPRKAAAPCAIAFLDPPYGANLAPLAVQKLQTHGWLAPGALCVVEVAAQEEFPPPQGFTLLKDKTWGAARVLFLQWNGR